MQRVCLYFGTGIVFIISGILPESLFFVGPFAVMLLQVSYMPWKIPRYVLRNAT